MPRLLPGAESAADVAVLRGVTAAARALAGESLPALDWLARLLVDLNILKLGVPTILAMYAWLRPDTGLRADPVRAVRGAARRAWRSRWRSPGRRRSCSRRDPCHGLRSLISRSRRLVTPRT